MKRLIAWLLEPFYFKTFLPYLGAVGFVLYGGGKGGDSDPPDYTPMAEASKEAAKIAAELGREQLAENKRQYDQNYAVIAPLVQAQAGLAALQTKQGDDYFNYMQQYSRPVEMSLFYDAMGLNADEIDQLNVARQAAVDRGTLQAQTAYESDVAKYNADFAANAGKTFYVDSNGNAIQGDQIQGFTTPQKVSGSGSGVTGYAGETPVTSSPSMTVMGHTLTDYTPGGVKKPTQNIAYSAEDQKMISSGYQLATTKDGRTVWVKSGSGTNPLAGSLEKPEMGKPDIDYTDANNLAVKLGLTATERQKAQEAAARQVINDKSTALEQRIGETDTQVYNRYANDIEAEAGQAVADSRAGFTNAINMAARQGLRYGFSPERLAAMASSQSVQQAAQQAAAANQTRKAATQTMYGRGVSAAQQGLTGVQQNRAMTQQDEALRYAKKLDTAGLYRGLPGASQGAYSTAIQAGNSAVNNQMQPSSLYMQGINQGNQTQLAGQQMKIQGLGNILNSQTSIANANSGGDSGLWGALGTVAGAGISQWSDRRLKKNIRQIGKHASGLAIYEFDYLWGEHAYGFMADEVMKVKPEAVMVADNGFMMVDYGQF